MRADAPGGADFAAVLFGQTAVEDLAPYAPQTLDALAEAALAHLGEPRGAGRHSLRVFNPDGSRDRRLAQITIVEVVNDNMPFLLDSTLAELSDRGLDLRLVAHPILSATRDGEGRLTRWAPAEGDAAGARESLIHIHVKRIGDEAREALAAALDLAYRDVRVSVEDWRAMRARIDAAAASYQADPPPLPVDEIAEAVQFLGWLSDNNFTFLGVREYRFDNSADGPRLDAVGGAGLGILRDPDVRVLRRGKELVTITPEVMEFLREPQALIIAKANVKSRVHRRAHMDYIGVKLFSKSGALEGELRLIGLFTSTAYTRSAQTIPYLRHKIARVIEAAHLDPESHSGKTLLSVLDTYPRDELFQVDVETLAAFAHDILQLYERPRLRVLARADRFDRFVSVLAFIPRDRYDTTVRLRVADYLCRVFKGRLSATYPFYPEGPLVRTHFIIGRDEGETPKVSREELEAGVAAIVRTWSDALRDDLAERSGAAGGELARRYARAFSAGYMENFSAADAMADIGMVERLSDAKPIATVVYRRPDDPPERARLKVFSRGRPIPLSERVPLIEHMGFRVVSEDTYNVAPDDGAQVWLHDMELDRASGGAVDVAALKPSLESLLGALFRGDAESDGFNALTIEAGLGWRDISLVRALARYLRQIRVGFSQDYLWQTLNKHAGLARKLVELFYLRFDPRRSEDAARRSEEQTAAVAAIEDALKAVTSLDEDRILRRFLNLVQAAIRTNFFQLAEDGGPRPVIAIKFESRHVAQLPLPRPLYEITVYSPRVEGIHLRFGKVARGGLRWSDRPQDFRTEILGLVKAQQVKNAVIVPVGAKGGFVPKRLPPPAQRDAWMAEGIASYKLFINALLDVTDNIVDDRIVPPQSTIRYDDDDPYLVVAADKGTATFSDIANAISIERGHWLGDAFASGGSVGYDHKKMGITARGAWEAVKRHFREMDVDIQTTPFTCVGVGDMSGDVFGNGMLLSPQTRLLAAFDHRDIFIDPDPDVAKSLAERHRLFDLPRSSWQDYDKALISKGGGVFPRSAKAIALSPEARTALALDQESATPQEVMTAILKAPVDLLFFGGIGTYIRAKAESDDSVGDRANDAIRVCGGDLRCKVVGEGANLGATQLGRIEAAQNGVRLDTDAIDNSAGVNTSDVEVNIKIALAAPLREGKLDADSRAALLASMTDEVAALVLRNNYQQTLALSLVERRGVEEIGFLRRMMQAQEREGRLDRAVEFLPDDAALAAREKQRLGMTRPELCVLLAYGKLSLHDHLLASRVPDDSYLGRELARYFPKELVASFPQAVETHRLRREIVATQLANAIVNRCGPAVVQRIGDETGADAPTIAYAFAAVRDVYNLTELNGEIDALDAKIDGAAQLDLYASVQRLLLSRLVWFARNVDFGVGLEAITKRFRDGVEALAREGDGMLPAARRDAVAQRRDALIQSGAPEALARRIASLDFLASAPDITLVAERAQADLDRVAAAFFAADETFALAALAAQARDVPVGDYFDRLALDSALERIASARRAIAAEIVGAKLGEAKGEARVAAWLEKRGEETARVRQQVAEIAASGLTLSKITVAAGLISDIPRV